MVALDVPLDYKGEEPEEFARKIPPLSKQEKLTRQLADQNVRDYPIQVFMTWNKPMREYDHVRKSLVSYKTSWESRSTFRSIWGNSADEKIHNLALQQETAFRKNGGKYDVVEESHLSYFRPYIKLEDIKIKPEGGKEQTEEEKKKAEEEKKKAEEKKKKAEEKKKKAEEEKKKAKEEKKKGTKSPRKQARDKYIKNWYEDKDLDPNVLLTEDQRAKLDVAFDKFWTLKKSSSI